MMRLLTEHAFIFAHHFSEDFRTDATVCVVKNLLIENYVSSFLALPQDGEEISLLVKKSQDRLSVGA